MQKQISMRYGRNYKLVLATVVPCLLILPFIFFMQQLKGLSDWQLWILIFVFLGLLFLFTLWLVLRVYPPTVLEINLDRISLTFLQYNFLSPQSFSFHIADIVDFTLFGENENAFVLFKTKNPSRTFQLSPATKEITDVNEFDLAMQEITEKLNATETRTSI